VASVNTLRAMKNKIAELTDERDKLSEFPKDEFIAIIRDVGFACTCCAKCCTRAFNGHVFLLDDDVERVLAISPDALIPAPDFELCDQHGNFYVSGYALRCRKNGDCIFLENNRCNIYEQRFRICRIYPYMLHREIGPDGKLDWRQISGINEHGEYHTSLTDEECEMIAKETLQYEQEVLEKEIAFYTFCTSYFHEHNLKPVRKVYDQRIRGFDRGDAVAVYVFDRGTLKRYTVKKEDY
jgi:Fe-S-cluster containining protein